MSESSNTATIERAHGIECIDPEAIVIALPRRSSLAVSGGVRTVAADRPMASDGINEETEPVLAD